MPMPVGMRTAPTVTVTTTGEIHIYSGASPTIGTLSPSVSSANSSDTFSQVWLGLNGLTGVTDNSSYWASTGYAFSSEL